MLWAILLVLVATLRIGATYGTLSRTTDEQAHIACGMEYLDFARYSYETQHPPLTRIMVAWLPHLNGAHSWGERTMWTEGPTILHRSSSYLATLTFARMGNLPFFWIACAVVYLWAKRYFDRQTAVIAVALFSFTPVVLGHAGVATTDMGLTAFCTASLLATLMLLERPSLRMGAVWGLMIGLAISSKFSFLPFYPASLFFGLILFWVVRRPAIGEAWTVLRSILLPALLGSVVAFFVVWAVYRFSFGPSPLTGSASVPFPELFDGIGQVMHHNDIGHTAYLFGQTSPAGFWYYYPAALLFKLPLGFLGLLGLGLVMAWRMKSVPVAILVGFSLGIFAVGAASRINIGIRHVLPLITFFAIIAAVGVRNTLEWQPNRTRIVVVLLAWMGLSSLWVHPDYLAYFNELALGHPEKILIDSDLDWGQDYDRAAERLRELNARVVAFSPSNFISEDAVKFPPLANLDPLRPMPGWNLVSITKWKSGRYGLHDDEPSWIDATEPTERVGRGMLLFYFPEK